MRGYTHDAEERLTQLRKLAKQEAALKKGQRASARKKRRSKYNPCPHKWASGGPCPVCTMMKRWEDASVKLYLNDEQVDVLLGKKRVPSAGDAPKEPERRAKFNLPSCGHAWHGIVPCPYCTVAVPVTGSTPPTVPVEAPAEKHVLNLPAGLSQKQKKVIEEFACMFGSASEDILRLLNGRRVFDRTIAVRQCPDCSADLAIVGDGTRADLVFVKHHS